MGPLLIPGTALVRIVLALGPAEGTAQPADWFRASANLSQLELAHEEGDHLDGGILSLDTGKRLVIWQGIPGELGCRRSFEARFDDVKAVRTGEPGGFTLEVRGQPKMLLIPRPHAPWLNAIRMEAQAVTRRAASGSALAGLAETNPSGASGAGTDAGTYAGGATISGLVSSRRIDLPPEVAVDTRNAVRAIQDALGLTPSPGALLQEALQGTATEAAVAEVLSTPAEFLGRAVRVRGTLARDGQAFRLEDGGAALALEPTPEAAKRFAAAAPELAGQAAEVVGSLRSGPAVPGERPSVVLSVWEFVRADAQGDACAGRVATVAEIATGAVPDGEAVCVAGQFSSQPVDGVVRSPGREAWALRDGTEGVWVTGRGPRGRGWSLDSQSTDDTREWLMVSGRVRRLDGGWAVEARDARLITPPARAASPPVSRLALRDDAPPAVVFSIPVDGEGDVAPDARLVIQFSRYMDSRTFEGRVRLRYAAGTGPESAFPALARTYDDTRRALVIDPGEVLQPGAVVECLLLPGIRDAAGRELAPRPGVVAAEGAVDVVRFRVKQ